MPADPKRVRDLFLALTELPEADRGAYLQQHTTGDAELHSAVHRLLAAHEQPASVLNQPAPGIPTADYAGNAERPGIMIGPYKLMEQIGEGGFGLVFVAEQMEPVKRRVALKVIKPGMDSNQVIARFEAERQALAMMDHPNIARVLDAGTTETGKPYFVMELVRGVAITDYCDQNHLTPAERLELFVSVCHAIQHAHQKGIIHRDIKPSNVLVTSHDGKPVAKVIDFGVAKAIHQHLTERTIYTQFAQMIGTPLYMSPEQAEMSGLDIDTRSDIYSLGVLLYELLTGSTPLERDKLVKAAYDEIRRAIREDEPEAPSDRLSSSKTLPSLAANRKTEPARLSRMLKGELDWIVMKALDKDRTRRYETANGLARDIQRYLSDDVVEARPASTGYRLRKFVRRHRVQVLAASLVLGALVLGILGTTWGLWEARKQQEIALVAQRAEAERAEGERRAKEQAILEAHKATEQAAIAEAVRKFLEEDIIGQADPNQDVNDGKSKDVELKLKTALDRAVPLIAERFKGKPLVEASLRRTIAEAYQGRGLLAEARSQLEIACELYRQQLRHVGKPVDHPIIQDPFFDAHLELTMLHHAMGEKQKALATLQLLQDQVHLLYGPGPEAIAVSVPLSAIRDILDGKNPAQTMKMIEENFRTYAEQSPETAKVMKEAATEVNGTSKGVQSMLTVMTLVNEERNEEAEKMLSKLIENDKSSSYLGTYKTLLIDVQVRLGKYAEAERSLNVAIESLRANGNAQQMFLSIATLANIYHLQGKHAEARVNYETARDGLRKALGEDHVHLGLCHKGLAGVLLAEKKYVEAEAEIRIAQSLYKTTVPVYQPQRLETTSILGAILAGKKKYDIAEPLLLSAYEELKKLEKTMPEARSTLLPEALERLIQFYIETNKPEEVKKWQAEKERFSKTPDKK